MASRTGERRMSVLQASFIGVGAMVGAGIFALLGATGEIAGAAVWLSFLIGPDAAPTPPVTSSSRG